MTIRTWEQRYGLPKPHRTEGGHRLYSERDVAILRWLSARQKEGVSIRRAVESWRVLEARGQDAQALAAERQETVSLQSQAAPGHQIDVFRDGWISACTAFDGGAADQVLNQAFSYFPAETVCTELLQKGIVQIGEGWRSGDVTVQQEHFATALAIRRLEALVAAAPQPLRSERILIFCAPDDQHVFSPLLLTFLLLRRGWNVLYLGANVPTEALSNTVEQIEPQLVIVSAQQLHTAANLCEVAKLLQTQDVAVGYGGTVFNHLSSLRQVVPGHFLGESLERALMRIEALLTAPEEPSQSATEPTNDVHQKAFQEFCAQRTLIESHVWSTIIDGGGSFDQLMQVNVDFAQTIGAALRLGHMEALGGDMRWMENLLISYRPSKQFICDYVCAYRRAAEIYLGEASDLIKDWLADLESECKIHSLQNRSSKRS